MRKIIHICCYISLLAFQIYSQDDSFLQKYQELSKKAPQDININLRLASTKSSFHQGEIIPLELSLSGSATNKYDYDGPTYDRSGRLGIDAFVVDNKAKTVDPLDDYFHKGFLIFHVGGLGYFGKLDSKPDIVKYELNEWIRFDKVGKFRLYIKSGRVSIGKFSDENFKNIAPVSNIIEFEIIPTDEKWKKETLEEAIKNLDSGATTKQHEAACRTLRFLGTEEAALEIIKRFTGDDKVCDFSFYMGLQGSPHRKYIIDEMEKALNRPEFPVSESFFEDLYLLSYFYKYPQSRPTFSDNNQDTNQKKFMEYFQSESQLKRTEIEYCLQQLKNNIKDKKGKALTVSVETAFGFGDRDNKAALIDSLAAVFSDIPTERQEILLEYRWEQINTPQMLPALRKLYELYNKEPENNQQSNLRDTVLRRIYELAPDEGRKLILEEFGRSQIRLTDSALSILSDSQLPEIEEIWLKTATNLNADYGARGKALILLERYGTKKSVSELERVYEKQIGQPGCHLQDTFLSYLFKHDSNFGLKMLRKALNERNSSKCYNTIFENIPSKYWSNGIEQIAVSFLDDENISVVKSMVEALGQNGSAAVKDKLWQRFETFSKMINSNETLKTKSFGDYSDSLGTIEISFIRALTQSPNWKLSETETDNLNYLCVTNECQDELKHPTREIKSKESF